MAADRKDPADSASRGAGDIFYPSLFTHFQGGEEKAEKITSVAKKLT